MWASPVGWKWAPRMRRSITTFTRCHWVSEFLNKNKLSPAYLLELQVLLTFTGFSSFFYALRIHYCPNLHHALAIDNSLHLVPFRFRNFHKMTSFLSSIFLGWTGRNAVFTAFSLVFIVIFFWPFVGFYLPTGA